MKSLFNKYRPIGSFILIFLGSYLLLTGAYLVYLHFGFSEKYYPDYITHMVARQTEIILTGLGYEASLSPSPYDRSMLLHINGKALIRVVEGCNAVSVIILFLSFVLALAQQARDTLLYIFAGAVLIYVLNLFRVAFLTIGIYKWPEQQELLHQIIFPLIIYSVVFVLWLFWIRKMTRKTTPT